MKLGAAEGEELFLRRFRLTERRGESDEFGPTSQARGDGHDGDGRSLEWEGEKYMVKH